MPLAGSPASGRTMRGTEIVIGFTAAIALIVVSEFPSSSPRAGCQPGRIVATAISYKNLTAVR